MSANPGTRDKGNVNIPTCVHIGDNDLIGNKFNGHDLHLYQQKIGIRSEHVVFKKESDDDATFAYRSPDNKYTQHLIASPHIARADLLHLHLIHNTPFEISLLPVLSSLKPVVWTLHDPWSLTGHCIYPAACENWKEHCRDCLHLDAPFAITHDTSALEFYIKKNAIQNSAIHAIVASKWMENLVRQSPVWEGKPIHFIPFGIDQEIFTPLDSALARRMLGISEDQVVLFARTQRHFKGLEVLCDTFANLAPYRKYVVLTVGEKGLLRNLPPFVVHKDFGWLKDDKKLALLYQACDIFLMPSQQEAFGMMAVEAMSCGKMVLALTGTALPKVINAPDCGVAVSAKDYPGELRRLLDSPEEVAKRSYNSLCHAREFYSIDRYVYDISAVYKEAFDSFKPSVDARTVLTQLIQYPPKPAVPAEIALPVARTSWVTKISLVHRVLAHYRQHGVHATGRKILSRLTDIVWRS